jgi:hypothetical protein
MIMTHDLGSSPGRSEVILVSVGVEVLYDPPAQRASRAVSSANGHHRAMSSTAPTFNLNPFSFNVYPSSHARKLQYKL